MEPTLIAVVGVISIVAVAAFSEKLGLAAPLSLVVVGIALSFVPGVPHPSIEPEWILAGVLPPLLYSAAVNMPAHDFRRNVKAISGLAVLLVVITTLGAGWLLHLLLPDLGWPTAFAVGAVISPTDAVAATSVGKRLGLPSRLLTVLEGEGLVNDASALVLLRSAIAAIAGSVSLWRVAGDFLYAAALACVIGLLVGWVNVRVRALLKDTVLNTAISFVVPFVAFVPAEALDASGVLAVVVAGLVTGHQSPRFLRAQDRLAEQTNWRTLAFLLESSVFLLMGLSLKTLLDEVNEQGLSPWQALTIGLLLSALVVVARMVFTVPLVGALHNDARRAAEAKPRLEQFQARLDAPDPDGRFIGRNKDRMMRRVGRISVDVDFLLNETLGWRSGVVLAWSGMRGAITVAAAQTLPQDTSHRPQLVIIAYVVAGTTLLVQGLTLPAVIRAVGVPGDDPERQREDYVRLLADLSAAASAALDDPGLTAPGGEPLAPEVLARARADSHVGAGSDAGRGSGSGSGGGQGGGPGSASPDPQREQYLRLRIAVLDAEQDALLAARSRGSYGSRALGHAQHMIDLEQARLQQLGDDFGD